MCACVRVCMWLVSHAATVISMSAVCLSVRPDSDSDDLTTEWLVVCFRVSGVVCAWVCVCWAFCVMCNCGRHKKEHVFTSLVLCAPSQCEMIKG